MKWLCFLLLLPLLLGARPVTSHRLGWSTVATVVQNWELEQCVNNKGGCIMKPIAAFDATTFEAEVTGLQRNKGYCWRIRPLASGFSYTWSNIVCV